MSPKLKKNAANNADPDDKVMWYVYILETLKGQLYTGSTNDVDKRMKAHKEGKGAKFTKSFGFKNLLYTESFASKGQALTREAQIKKLTRQQKLALINSLV